VNALRAAIVRAARRTTAGGEVPRGTRAGDGFAFDRLRSYVNGDDPRRIDWPATARLGELQTRVYLEETTLVLAAIVDESASMRLGRERPHTAAAYKAIAAWFGAAQQADRAHRVVDDRIVFAPRAASDARAGQPFHLQRSLALAIRALPAGASLLLISDGLDLTPSTDDDALLLRVSRRFDATVLLASDPWIDGLPLRGFVSVRDAETRRTSQLFIGARARERYRRASVARDAAMRERFRRARWRVGTLDEGDGAAALARTFGLGGAREAPSSG
jgi:uncharacterized protein (DUF58 family)